MTYSLWFLTNLDLYYLNLEVSHILQPLLKGYKTKSSRKFVFQPVRGKQHEIVLEVSFYANKLSSMARALHFVDNRLKYALKPFRWSPFRCTDVLIIS